jgi:hypothetical protein
VNPAQSKEVELKMKTFFYSKSWVSNRFPLVGWIILAFMAAGCRLASASPTPVLTSTLSPADQTLSADEKATLSSLKLVDDYPLYSMRYVGTYASSASSTLTDEDFSQPESIDLRVPEACQQSWGCALFAALGDEEERVYGRNFDWRFSPALLLFTDPPDGYASVSMVDIAYLGFEGDRSKNLLDLSLSERKALMGAPALPFDGMNEQGVAVGMAAVPAGDMQPDPGKRTIDELAVIREILDHAATVDEAVEILAGYNIDMGNVPLHYLVASATGEAALVEFYQGEMQVFRNQEPWQLATNFLVASTDGKPQDQCPRYDRLSQELQEAGGHLTAQEALSLLADVSQDHPQEGSDTQWSIVYDLTGGDINIIMGRKYAEGAHLLHLDLASR